MRAYLPSFKRISLFSLAVFLVLLLLSASPTFASVTITTPTDYTVAQLDVGDEYYLDRTYTVTSIPIELATGTEEWIKTKNNDKYNTTSSDFLQFTISQDSIVYVAYDSRATSLPNWLSSNFTMTSLTIGVTDSDMGHFDVYQQTFTAGTVSLGGNLAVPASGAGSNYIVIVQPTTPVVEICDNSLDDDGDSLIDCADPDCSTDPACQTCTDADFDTFFAESGCGTAIDCDDTDFDINPGAAEICNDTIDNDCDNLIDCNDGDCFADPACSGGNVNIITPADYTVAQLNVGDEYYLDRTYTVASIPPELATGAEEWIKTQNSDKSNTTSSDFLQFTISQDSTVYVAYDSRATSLPNWLSSNFTMTSLTIGVTDSDMGHFDVYQQTFTAGTVSLGGNLAVPASGAGSNYIVIVQPTSPVPPVTNFSGTPTSGVAPLLVSFSDSSSGDVDTWLWDFGDTGTSTLQNPSHTYNSAGDYTVTLQVTGPAGSDTATLTDYITVTATPTPPSASFSGTPVSGVAPLLVSFSDSSSGDVDTWSWSFGDGGTSTAQHPSYTYNTAGDYTVTLQVTGPGGSDTATLTDYITVTEATGNEEHIYIAYVYANPIEALYSSLQAMGASQEGDVWTYTNYSQNKQYIIHPIGNDVEALKQALMTQDAHVMISGHANYGLGPIPATTQEKIQLYINDIYYIDDPRILNVSSMRFGVSVSSLINSQAYPNWQPVFQDGTSGIMPFCFWDPKGPPPYNYWISYQIPGDSTYYRVDPPHYLPMEREPGCGSPAWYSPNRKSPDPTNPNERQYFINNLPLALSIGNWITSQAISGYYDQDYLYKQADPLNNQDNEVRWVFKVPQDGNYSVTAFWPASPQNTTNAQYSVFHAGDTTTVAKNQTINGGQWNELGVFSFIAGDEYAVILTDNADAGNVVADAVRITHASDPGILDEEIDNLTYPRYHYSRKTILFLKELGIKKEDMNFKRLFYNSCQTGKYYLDTLGHGIVWYSVQSVAGKGAMPYLINYMNGKSDEEIWEIVNSIERFYDYYDFSKLPSEQ